MNHFGVSEEQLERGYEMLDTAVSFIAKELWSLNSKGLAQVPESIFERFEAMGYSRHRPGALLGAIGEMSEPELWAAEATASWPAWRDAEPWRPA